MKLFLYKGLFQKRNMIVRSIDLLLDNLQAISNLFLINHFINSDVGQKISMDAGMLNCE